MHNVQGLILLLRPKKKHAPPNFTPQCSDPPYGVMPLGASSLLHYGITPAFSAKTDVTMRFPVETYPKEMISRLFIFFIYMSVTYVKFVKLPDMVRYHN